MDIRLVSGEMQDGKGEDQRYWKVGPVAAAALRPSASRKEKQVTTLSVAGGIIVVPTGIC